MSEPADGFGEEVSDQPTLPSGSVSPASSGIQVLDRAVALLRALSLRREPVRLRDVVRDTGLSASTARRLLAALVTHDLCEQTDDGRYRLGLALFEFGTHVQAGFDVRERGRPVLERLSRETGLTAFLAVRRGDRAICLERVEGAHAFTLAWVTGGSLPLHMGGAPMALLAYEPDDEIGQYLEAQTLEAATPTTITGRDAFFERLLEFRKLGYTVSDGDVTVGVAALGAPVFGNGSRDRPIAAISVAGLIPQVMGDRQQAVTEALLDAGKSLSTDLGADVPILTSRAATDVEGVA